MAKKKFAVFDIDGTLIRWQLYHAIVDRLADAGHVPEEAYQKVRAARLNWKKRNGQEAFRTYEMELISAYEASLPNLQIRDYEEAAKTAFEDHKDQVYTYTLKLLKDLKAQSYLIFAISASPYEIVEMVSNYYGFDDCVGTMYAQKNGQFTGKLNLSIIHRKAELLKELVTKHDATYTGSIGVGDSDSDIAMLETVKQPIAYNPTRKLFVYAYNAGWKIVVERKNMVYELVRSDGIYTLVPPED
jgi:HAD superfamily hydrolase (TIGR01490 family)